MSGSPPLRSLALIRALLAEPEGRVLPSAETDFRFAPERENAVLLVEPTFERREIAARDRPRENTALLVTTNGPDIQAVVDRPIVQPPIPWSPGNRRERRARTAQSRRTVTSRSETR